MKIKKRLGTTLQALLRTENLYIYILFSNMLYASKKCLFDVSHNKAFKRKEKKNLFERTPFP